jgi:hypothetical protein
MEIRLSHNFRPQTSPCERVLSHEVVVVVVVEVGDESRYISHAASGICTQPSTLSVRDRDVDRRVAKPGVESSISFALS